MASDLDRRSTLSGLTEGEAREFNRIFVISFCIFVGIAILAAWRAWLFHVAGSSGSEWPRRHRRSCRFRHADLGGRYVPRLDTV